MTRRALVGADVFDGERLRPGAVLLDGEVYRGTVPEARVPTGYALRRLAGGILMPGFVDLQVNGGGGAMFGDRASLEAMAEAHRGLGTRGFLPTLITDTPGRTAAALDAVEGAIRDGVAGVLGVHLEGPHIAPSRAGAHDRALIRPMQDADERLLLDAADRLPNVMVTLAPEAAGTARIGRLARGGVSVSLGHSECGYDMACAAFDAGARCATHLYNAMSPLRHREPGLVGAALDHGGASAGVIADGVHVHPAALRAALAAKRGPGALFLVTDAMAVAGTGAFEFRLGGRRVLRRDGRLTLEDGTLAGADLDMAAAVRVAARAGASLAAALGMATSGPAAMLRAPGGAGRLTVGAPWRGVHLDAGGRYAAPQP